MSPKMRFATKLSLGGLAVRHAAGLATSIKRCGRATISKVAPMAIYARTSEKNAQRVSHP